MCAYSWLEADCKQHRQYGRRGQQHYSDRYNDDTVSSDSGFLMLALPLAGLTRKIAILDLSMKSVSQTQLNTRASLAPCQFRPTTADNNLPLPLVPPCHPPQGTCPPPPPTRQTAYPPARASRPHAPVPHLRTTCEPVNCLPSAGMLTLTVSRLAGHAQAE